MIRRASHADATRITEIHVAAWRAGYRGIFTEAQLDAVTFDQRLPWWRWMLSHGPAEFHVHVAEDETGVILGFGSACPSDESPTDVGEVAQLYVAPSAWGSGLAETLLRCLESDLSARGCREGVLHVARANLRARRFYERLGWRDTGEEHREVVWGVESVTTTYRTPLSGRS